MVCSMRRKLNFTWALAYEEEHRDHQASSCGNISVEPKRVRASSSNASQNDGCEKRDPRFDFDFFNASLFPPSAADDLRNVTHAPSSWLDQSTHLLATSINLPAP